MRKSTIGALIGLLAVGCGDPSDDKHDDAPESEQAARGTGLYSVTFAVKANPASLGSASVSIFNALGETCAGTSCDAYPLNQAYFQATPASGARFVGWSGCNFVGLGHRSAATFLENVGVLDETCTANFSDATGTTPDTTDPTNDFPTTFPDPGTPDEVEPDQRPTRPTPEGPGTDAPEDGEQKDGSADESEPSGGTVLDPTGKDEDAPGKTTPEKTTPEKTTPEKTSPEKTSPEKTSPEKTSPEKTSPEKTSPEKTSPEKTSPEKTSPEKTSPEKTSPEKTSPEKTPPETDDGESGDEDAEGGTEAENPLFPESGEVDPGNTPELPWN